MRFFSKKDIENYRIPTPAAFGQVIESLRTGFSEVYAISPKEIPPRNADPVDFVDMKGALLIGSAARGSDLKPTSDVDVIAFLDDLVAPSLYSVVAYFEKFGPVYASRIDQLKAEYNIPVNIYWVLASRLEQGKTRNNKQFLGHAIRSMEGLVENDGTKALLCGIPRAITEMYDKAPRLTRDCAQAYLRGKSEKLVNALGSLTCLTEEEKLKAFADAVNGPFHGARQLLDVLGVPYVDTKQGVVDALQKAGGFHKIIDPLLHVKQIAEDYNKAIEQHVAKVSDFSYDLYELALMAQAMYALVEMERMLDWCQ